MVDADAGGIRRARYSIGGEHTSKPSRPPPVSRRKDSRNWVVPCRGATQGERGQYRSRCGPSGWQTVRGATGLGPHCPYVKYAVPAPQLGRIRENVVFLAGDSGLLIYRNGAKRERTPNRPPPRSVAGRSSLPV
jgi:hypothetical protein